MVKRKKPTHNLITEALATANPTSGLNPKAVLLYLNRTNSVENDDENLALVKHMIQNGLNTNEFIQVKGNSINGFFKLNPDYQPIEQNLPPLIHVPPSPPKTPEPLENFIKKRPQRKRVVKKVEVEPQPEPNHREGYEAYRVYKFRWDESKGNVILITDKGEIESSVLDEITTEDDSNSPEIDMRVAKKDPMFKVLQRLKSKHQCDIEEAFMFLRVMPFNKDKANSMIKYGIIPQLVRFISHSQGHVSAISLGYLLKLTHVETNVYKAMFATDIVDKLYQYINSPILPELHIQLPINAARLTVYLSHYLSPSVESFLECYFKLILSCAYLLKLDKDEVSKIAMGVLTTLIVHHYNYDGRFYLSNQEIKAILNAFVDTPVEAKQRFVWLFTEYIARVEFKHVLVLLKAGLLDNLYKLMDICKDYTEIFLCLNIILQIGDNKQEENIEMLFNRGFVKKILPMMDDKDRKVRCFAYRFILTLVRNYTTEKLRKKLGVKQLDTLFERLSAYLIEFKRDSGEYEKEEISFDCSEQEDRYLKLPTTTVEKIIEKGIISGLVVSLKEGSVIEKKRALKSLTEFTFSQNHCRAIVQLNAIPGLVSLLSEADQMANDSLLCLLNISVVDLKSCKTMFELDIEKTLPCISSKLPPKSLDVLIQLTLKLSEYLTKTPTLKDFELKSMRIRAFLLEHSKCKDAVVKLEEAIRKNIESQNLEEKLIPLLFWIEELEINTVIKKLIQIGNYARLNPQMTELIYNASFLVFLFNFAKIEELRESALFCLNQSKIVNFSKDRPS